MSRIIRCKKQTKYNLLLLIIPADIYLGLRHQGRAQPDSYRDSDPLINSYNWHPLNCKTEVLLLTGKSTGFQASEVVTLTVLRVLKFDFAY